MKSESIRTVIHFPPDVRAWVREKAERDDRTITSTIIRLLRAAMQQSEKAADGSASA